MGAKRRYRRVRTSAAKSARLPLAWPDAETTAFWDAEAAIFDDERYLLVSGS